MRSSYLGRLTGVMAAAGAFLAALAAPVFAADDIKAGFPDVTVPVGGTAIDPLGPVLWSTAGPVTLTGVTVSYELRGLTGVRIAPSDIGGGECETPSPIRVVCTDPRGLSFEGETVEQYLPVTVSAARTATPGDSGTVTVTFSADGLTPITGQSTVRVVGDRPSLPVTGPSARQTGAIGLFLITAGVSAVLAARRLATAR